MSPKGIFKAVAIAATACGLLAAPAALGDTSGDYVVSDDATVPAVFNFTPAGARTTITSGGNLVNPEGLVRLASSDYLVADKGPAFSNAIPDGRVIRVLNGAQSVLTSGGNLFNPHGIALSLDRTKAYTAGRDGRVVEITIATGVQRLIAPAGGNLTDLRGIAVEATGSLLVINSSATPGAVARLVRIDPNTGAQQVIIAGPPLGDPRAVLVRPNGDLVIGDTGATGNGFILNVDLPAGAASVLSGGAFYADNSVPGALALDTLDRIIAADRNTGGGGTFGRIFAVNTGGVPSDIVPATTQLLSEPSGLAVVPPTCRGQFATMVGTNGPDTLLGTPAPDVIVGLGGKDIEKGKGGKDILCGNAGKDKLNGGAGRKARDVCVGGGGRDTSKGCEKLKSIP